MPSPFAALLALAARGARDRWGRSVGVATVVLAIGWSLFGMFVTVTCCYA